jgi:hypothetical protein
MSTETPSPDVALAHLLELIEQHGQTQIVVNDALAGIDLVETVTARMPWLAKVNKALVNVRAVLENYQVLVAQLHLIAPAVAAAQKTAAPPPQTS